MELHPFFTILFSLVGLYIIFNPKKTAEMIAQRIMIPDWVKDRNGMIYTGERVGKELLLLPFRSKPDMPSRDAGRPLTYSELLDPILKEDGVGSWFNNAVVERLHGMGCQMTEIAQKPRFARQFIMEGELLNVVRQDNIARIAFKVQLNLGNHMILSKVYTGAKRSARVRAPHNHQISDKWVGRASAIGRGSRSSNRLLDDVLEETLAEFERDLSRILPYLKAPAGNQLQEMPA